MRVGALCMGYGGIELALDSLFATDLRWYCENDPHASKVLAHHWPDVPNLGDLTAVDWKQVERVDAITAGYPCQPFSHAGNRKGTDDARHLWPHIAACLRVLRPRHGFFENVAGHLSLGFDSVLADLAEGGFDAEWTVLRAADVGAPHGRARLFILASRRRQLRNRGARRRRTWNARTASTGRTARRPRTCRCSCSKFRCCRHLRRSRPRATGTPATWAQRRSCYRHRARRTRTGRGCTARGAWICGRRCRCYRRPGRPRGGSATESVYLLPTPSAADGMGGHLTRGGDRSDELLLPGVARSLGGITSPPSGDGNASSDDVPPAP